MRYLGSIVGNFKLRTVGMVGQINFLPRPKKDNIFSRGLSSVSTTVNHALIRSEIERAANYNQRSNFQIFPNSSSDFGGDFFRMNGVSEISIVMGSPKKAFEALYRAPLPDFEKTVKWFEGSGFKVYAQSDLRTVERSSNGDIIKPGEINLRFSYSDLYIGGDPTSVGADYIYKTIPAEIGSALAGARQSLAEAQLMKIGIKDNISLIERKNKLEQSLTRSIAQRASYRTQLKNLPSYMETMATELIKNTRNDEELRDARKELFKIEKKRRQWLTVEINNQSKKIENIDAELMDVEQKLKKYTLRERGIVSLEVQPDIIANRCHFYKVEVSLDQLHHNLEETEDLIKSLEHDITQLDNFGELNAKTKPLTESEAHK